MGRPSSYTPEIAEEICQRLAEGQSLIEICRDAHMPGESTVYSWVVSGKHAGFQERYAQARSAQMERYADEIVEIADDGTNDWLTRYNAQGEAYEVLNTEHVQRSRLRVDARKWLMAKRAPKKWGDKLEALTVNVTGIPKLPSDDGLV